MIDPDRLTLAYETARRDLLDERTTDGHWVGRLASSALSTATALSALALVDRAEADAPRPHEMLVVGGLRWLAANQNLDGGWGDTDRSLSNIATTMLVTAAFELCDAVADHAEMLARAKTYIEAQGGVAGLRARYGKDKTFAAPILANCALAGMVPWRETPALPFELACLPQSWYRLARLPVVSYAIPALVAIGQVRYHHERPRNPIVRLVRRAAIEPSLNVLDRLQPAGGGFLEATPLTSFVVMSLVGCGRSRHDVARRGIRFLEASARADGSWPIDTNLATWNTSLSINALGDDLEDLSDACLDWLLACQRRQPHPYTGAPAGGWGWSDLDGAVPDADDTAGALLALSAIHDAQPPRRQHQIQQAAAAGAAWLLDLQNRDGGWPTFCRGWGTLPFDRSGCDLTAHALRALHVWRRRLTGADEQSALRRRMERAVARGWDYLSRTQQPDGSWPALWFGNQHHPREENFVYGTAKALLAFRDLDRLDTPPARKATAWLVQNQNLDGGWGGGPREADHDPDAAYSSVEETALAVEALAAPALAPGMDGAASLQPALGEGLQWLVEAVESGRHRDSSPIGFYFAKLWYYEELYPLTFTVSALGQAVRRLRSTAPPIPSDAHLHTRL